MNDDDYETPEDEVHCDERCGAKLEPETPEEIKAAYVHWHEHRYLYGCSHGR